MNSERTSPRRPLLAGGLQFLSPGLGHLYSGRPLRGLTFYFLSLGVLLFSFLAFLVLSAPLNLVVLVVITLATMIFSIFDALRSARNADPNYRLARYNRWYIYILILIAVTLVGRLESGCIVTYVAQAFRIPTESMEPTLLMGDQIVVNRAMYAFCEPKRGDVAAFRMPNQPQTILLKRIVALPGETIEIRDKSVLVNGKILTEPYARTHPQANSNAAFLDSLPPTRIPDGTYFLMGDNRDNSLDSRAFGPVRKDWLLGELQMIYLSMDPKSGAIRWNRIGRVPN